MLKKKKKKKKKKKNLWNKTKNVLKNGWRLRTQNTRSVNWVTLTLLKRFTKQEKFSMVEIERFFFFYDNLNVAQQVRFVFSLLPDDKTVDWSKLEQFPDDILKYI